MRSGLKECGNCSRGSTAWAVGLCLVVLGLALAAQPALAQSNCVEDPAVGGNCNAKEVFIPDGTCTDGTCENGVSCSSDSDCRQIAAAIVSFCSTATTTKCSSAGDCPLGETCVPDDCAFNGDTATVEIFATLHFNAARNDIGIYSSLDDDGVPETGTCLVNILDPNDANQLVIDQDGDACGDVLPGDLANFAFSQVTIECLDADMDGSLDFGSCFSWKNIDESCSGPSEATPNAGSKCFCENINIPVTVPPVDPCLTFPTCSDGNPCTDDTCEVDPTTGEPGCVFNNDDTNACTDGNACTGAAGAEAPDSCQSGVCQPGSATVCTASDQCHDIGVCNSSTGVCSNPLKDEGEACGNPSDTACDEPDTCDGAGNCVDNIADNTAPCDDSDACTATDGTEGGSDFCSGTDKTCNTEEVSCTPDANDCTIDTCRDGTFGVCSSPTAQGTSCDDNGQVGPTCDLADTCDGDGLCVDNIADNTAPCDDSDACTATDGTEGGSDFCSGTDKTCNTEEVSCIPDANDCTIDTCRDGTFGVCSSPTAQGTSCDDNGQVGPTCDLADTCDGDGLCVDNIADNTAPCDDSDACTATDGTEGGSDFCSGTDKTCNTEEVSCTPDANDCTIDTCRDGTFGVCSSPTAQGTSCDDNGQVGPTCDLADTCDGDGLCVDNIADNTAPCDDSDACTATDGTEGGDDFCSGTDKTCNTEEVSCTPDANDCTIDTCRDGTFGVCSSPTAQGTSCDDNGEVGPTCDLADTCDGDGLCVDNIADNTAPCDDSDACTATDGTEGGDDFCSGTDKTCNTEEVSCTPDANDCTIDTCRDGTFGVCSSPTAQGTSCDDNGQVGPTCDLADTCDGDGLCVDNIADNTAPCDDSDACTATDGTEGGSDFCSGTDKTCNTEEVSCTPDANDCTIDTCRDGNFGVCSSPTAQGTSCDDLDACTDTDVCDGAGGCAGTDIPVPLTVIKTVVNLDGGGLADMDFTLGLTGEDDFPGDSDGTEFSVEQGASYAVSENLTNQPPAGDLSGFYTKSFSDNGDCADDDGPTCDPTTGDGLEGRTCTVTNTEIDRQNQASIQIDGLTFDFNLDACTFVGDFDISNESEQAIEILFTDFDVTLEVQSGGKGPWSGVDAETCTFADRIHPNDSITEPYIWDAETFEVLTVSYTCTLSEASCTQLEPGDNVRVTAKASISDRRRAFSFKTTGPIE